MSVEGDEVVVVKVRVVVRHKHQDVSRFSGRTINVRHPG